MGKIILINPHFGFEWSKHLAMPNLPLNILHIGSALKEHGHEVVLIDQVMDADWEIKLQDALKNGTTCIGLSSMTGTQISNALEVARKIRELTEKPIVWGGVHPSIMPDQSLENNLVDIVVRGEGEETMAELATALEAGRSLGGIEGISYKENGKSRHNPPRKFIDLNRYPPLDYELLDMGKYIVDYKGHRAINFTTSRGCVHECSYCYVQSFHNRRWRTLATGKVIERMSRLIKQYGINRFWFEDDEFFLNLDRTRELLKGIKKMKVTWASRGAGIESILRMDSDFLELMEKSGCHRLATGVESGSNRILNLIGKKTSREEILAVSRKLSHYNFFPRFNFMMGFPTESFEDLRKTISLALQIKSENKNAMITPFSIFTPYPGCALYELAVEHGLESPERLEDWSGFRLQVDNSSWLPEKMKKTIRMLAFTTPFLNEPLDTSPTLPVKVLSVLYRPIARKRIKSLFPHLAWEIYIANWLGLYDSKPRSKSS